MSNIKNSDVEVLEKLLRYGGAANPGQLAEKLLNSFGGRLDSVLESDSISLNKFEGMSEGATVLLKLIPDCAGMYSKEQWKNKICLTTTAEKGYYVADIIGSPPTEKFFMLCFDKSGNLLCMKKMFEGGITHTGIDLREIVEYAMNSGAEKVVVAHNHPSGNMQWSKQDELVTRYIKKALEQVGIELDDHMVVCNNQYVSMKEAGII